jgi:hypothetical protein
MYAGFTLGFLLGFILSFTVSNEFMVLIMAVICSCITIPVSFLIEKTTDYSQKNDDFNSKNNPKIKNNREITIIFPIILAWIGTFFVTSSKGFFNFTFPYFYYGNGDEAWISMIYLANIFQYLGQIWALNYITNIKITLKRKLVLLAIIMTFISAVFIVYNHQTWIISVIFSVLGISYGFIMGISQKITVDYGTKTGSIKYSIINEVLLGIGFGVMPIITGYVIDFSVNTSGEIWGGIQVIFITLSIISILALFSSILIMRNLNKSKKEIKNY